MSFQQQLAQVTAAFQTGAISRRTFLKSLSLLFANGTLEYTVGAPLGLARSLALLAQPNIPAPTYRLTIRSPPMTCFCSILISMALP